MRFIKLTTSSIKKEVFVGVRTRSRIIETPKPNCELMPPASSKKV